MKMKTLSTPQRTLQVPSSDLLFSDRERERKWYREWGRPPFFSVVWLFFLLSSWILFPDVQSYSHCSEWSVPALATYINLCLGLNFTRTDSLSKVPVRPEPRLTCLDETAPQCLGCNSIDLKQAREDPHILGQSVMVVDNQPTIVLRLKLRNCKTTVEHRTTWLWVTREDKLYFILSCKYANTCADMQILGWCIESV